MKIFLSFFLVLGIMTLNLHASARDSRKTEDTLKTANEDVTFPKAVSKVLLRDPVVVLDKNVTLGDVFEGVKEGAHEILTRAPLPGNKALLPKEKIRSYLDTYHLSLEGEPRDVIIYRKSLTLTAKDIENLLGEALKKREPQNEWKVILDQPSLRIEAPLNSPSNPCVDHVDLDALRERFDATLVIQDDEHHPVPYRVLGRLIKVVDVPVLVRSLGPGELITRDNIEWQKLRVDQVNRNVVLTVESLIGLTPRSRLIRSQEPLKIEDLTTPKTVRKGTEVSIVLRTPSLILVQRKAQALEDGAVGELIKVCNTTSKKIVMGKVKDASTVEVELAH